MKDRDSNSEIDPSYKVPFRHLSMIAQIRSDDEDVYLALEKSGYIKSAKKPSNKLKEKLSKIRFWISSSHFPDELRIQINDTIDHEKLVNFNFSIIDFIQRIIMNFENLEVWNSSTIGNCINDSVKEMNLNLRDAYHLLYLIIIGKSSGPKLARLLQEVDKDRILSLLSKVKNN